MNDKNIQEKPKNMELIIVEYIYNNPMISHRDLKRELTKNNKKMTSKTLNTYLYGDVRHPIGLIEKKHILAHGERTYNGKKYDDIFEFNEEKLKYYPDIMQSVVLNLVNRGDFLMKFITDDLFVDELSFKLDFLMNLGLSIQIDQNPKSKKIFFSDVVYDEFGILVKLLIFNCFLNNPEMWYIYEKEEDLNFSIKINAKYSEIPTFFETFSALRFKCLQTHNLYNKYFSRKIYDLIKDIKKNGKLKHDDIDLFYAKAKFEHENRDKKNKLDSLLNDPLKRKKLEEKIKTSLIQKLISRRERDNRLDEWFENKEKLETLLLKLFNLNEAHKDIYNFDYYVNLIKKDEKKD